MARKTQAEKLVNCKDFNKLWSKVDVVDRLVDDEGIYDLYTYPDGSQLVVRSNSQYVKR